MVTCSTTFRRAVGRELTACPASERTATADARRGPHAVATGSEAAATMPGVGAGAAGSPSGPSRRARAVRARERRTSAAGPPW